MNTIIIIFLIIINNNNHLSIGEKPIDVDYSDLTGEIETDSEARKFKLGDIARIKKQNKIILRNDLAKSFVKRNICLGFCIEK